MNQRAKDHNCEHLWTKVLFIDRMYIETRWLKCTHVFVFTPNQQWSPMVLLIDLWRSRVRGCVFDSFEAKKVFAFGEQNGDKRTQIFEQKLPFLCTLLTPIKILAFDRLISLATKWTISVSSISILLWMYVQVYPQQETPNFKTRLGIPQC